MVETNISWETGLLPLEPSEDWTELFTAHRKRQCKVYVDPSKSYLLKVKKRSSKSADLEFFNLALMHAIMEEYQRELEVAIHTPEPYIVQESNIIMEYMNGTELDRLIRGNTLDDEALNSAGKLFGQLWKIKENECINHGDFEPRHIFINNGLSVIDWETATFGTARLRNESYTLTHKLKEIGASVEFIDVIRKGYTSIPEVSMREKALPKVAKKYSKGPFFYFTN